MDLSDLKRIKLLLDILSDDPDLLKFIAEQLALAEQNNDPLDEFIVELNEWLSDKSRALSSVG